uniref:TSEN34 N-terminal domain-containing protein n=1 Tax=Anopheles funestus TaxID=62324 RepID=A0A182RRZ6_ANOFN
MNRIEVSYMHGRGVIFDAEDYLKLRLEWRIPGNLIGVSVSHPRNVNQQGMPVVFSKWELKLLLDNQIIRLVDHSSALQRAPSDEEAHLYACMVERQKEELRMPAIEKRLEAFQKHLPKIIEGKRKKLLKTGVKEEDIHLDAEQLVREERERIMKENSMQWYRFH